MVTKQKQISGKPFNCNLCGHFQYQPAKRQGSPFSSAHLCSAVLSPCTALLLTSCKLLCFPQPNKNYTSVTLHTGTSRTPSLCPSTPHCWVPTPALCEGGARQSIGLILLVLPSLGKMWVAQTKETQSIWKSRATLLEKGSVKTLHAS